MKKIKNKFVLIILLLVITVGYALLSTNISIVGVSKIKNARWSIYLDNIQVNDSSVTSNSATINSDKTSVNYSVTLNIPGDFYEFTVDVVNDGTIDAMIDSIVSKIKINDNEFVELNDSTIPNYLNYSVNYANGSIIREKHELKAGSLETYKIRVEFNKDIIGSDLPIEEQTVELSLSVNYVQKDNTSISIPKLAVGDYFSLIPDATLYSISMNDTGYDSDQTITPRELSLWRVINKNSDGSIDAISEYTSSNDVYLKGTKGYANLVNTLQSIAQSYKDSKYTINARIFGYDGQTKIIEDTSYFDGSTNESLSNLSTPNTISGVGEEFNNGIFGDTLYLKDYQLVSNIYGNVSCHRINDKSRIAAYWINSRSYSYHGDSYYSYTSNGINLNGDISNTKDLRTYNKAWKDDDVGYALRPIITIKANPGIIDGLGSKNNPYIFN